MIHLVINQNPDILGSTPVFMGTRARLGYLEAGDSLGKFLEDLLSVRKERALVRLELARHNLTKLGQTAKRAA